MQRTACRRAVVSVEAVRVEPVMYDRHALRRHRIVPDDLAPNTVRHGDTPVGEPRRCRLHIRHGKIDRRTLRLRNADLPEALQLADRRQVERRDQRRTVRVARDFEGNVSAVMTVAMYDIERTRIE